MFLYSLLSVLVRKCKRGLCFVKSFSFNTCIYIRDPGLSRNSIKGKVMVPWDVTRCGLLGICQRFRGTYSPSTLKMDAVGKFELLVNFYSID